MKSSQSGVLRDASNDNLDSYLQKYSYQNHSV